MNRPQCDRPAVALLASDSLGPEDAARIRRHLAGCPACREYHRQLRDLAEAHLAAANRIPGVTLREVVYARVAAGTRDRDRVRAPGWGWFRWGPALAWSGAAAALVLAVLTLVPWRPPSAVPSGPAPAGGSPLAAQGTALRPPEPGPVNPANPTGTGAAVVAAVAADPTMVAYRRALGRSEGEFDRLLAAGARSAGGDHPLAFRPGGAPAGVLSTWE